MNLIEPSNIKDNALSPKPCATFLNRESIHPRAESTFSQLLQIGQSNNAFLRSYFGHRWSDTMGPGADHAQIIGHFYESITRRTEVWQRRRHSNISLFLSYFLTITRFLSSTRRQFIWSTPYLSLSLFLAPHSLYFSLDAIKRRQTRMRLTWRKREREDVRLVCNVTI